MADELYNQMLRNVTKRIRLYFVFYTVFIALVLFYDELVALVNIAIFGDKDTSERARTLLQTIAAAVSSGIMFLAVFLKDIQLHIVVDRLTFKLLKKVNRRIIDELIKAGREVQAYHWENMAKKPKEVKRLFYSFINKQAETRSLAFTYWEGYYTKLYVLTFGAIVLLASVIILGLRGKFDYSWLLLLPLLIVIFAVAHTIEKRTQHAILDLPEQQIREIRVTQSEQLKQQIDTRFI